MRKDKCLGAALGGKGGPRQYAVNIKKTAMLIMFVLSDGKEAQRNLGGSAKHGEASILSAKIYLWV